MKQIPRAGILLMLIACVQVVPCLAQQIEYPRTRRVEHVDNYHGILVPDPYRWMEEMQSEETIEWARSQDDLFRGYVEEATERDWIVERIKKVRDFDFIGVPTKVGDRYFHLRAAAGQSSSILSVSNSAESDGRIIFDPETALEEGEQWRGWRASPDGKLLLYGISSDKQLLTQLRIMEVDTGKLLTDRIDGIQGSANVAWLADGSGFYYRQFELQGDRDQPEIVNPCIRLHRLGTDPKEDPVVFRVSKRDTFLWGPVQSSDRRFVLFDSGERNERKTTYYVLDLQQQNAEAKRLFEVEDTRFKFVDAVGEKLLFDTAIDAPRGRLVSVDLNQPKQENWQELIPESEDALLAVVPADKYLIGQYLHNAVWKLRVFDLSGRELREMDLPVGGGAGFVSRLGEKEVLYSFGNLTDPNAIYRFDPSTATSKLIRRTQLGFDASEYVTRQVFYTNPQGRQTSMFVAHRKDLEFDGNVPVWIYGFGHGRWAALPWFQPHWLTWLDMGGVFAVPAMRGGGEYGDEWYEGGIRRNKQNAIDDFIASVEWFVQQKITKPGRIVAYSGSAGGPVPAAAILQRPKLFGACVIDNPFLDMLRYPEYAFGFTTAFGSPQDRDDFKALHAYSPVHNVQPDVSYPPTLISIAENDTSTVPMHGYKFIANMQHERKGEKPYLLQMVWDAGHYSYGKTTEQRIETQTNQLAFLMRVLDLRVPE